MCAQLRRAFAPQLLVIALAGLGTAACSDSTRFSSNPFDSGVTGSIPPAANGVQSQPLPRLGSNAPSPGPSAAVSEGASGGGRGMGSYQPPNADVTGSLAPASPPPKPAWTWEGGTPVTVESGETIETLSHRYHVPVSAIMEANNLASRAQIHPGQHLVIPRRRGPASTASAPEPRVASTARTIPSASPPPPRSALTPPPAIHVVTAGQTLHSIARLYHKSVLLLAKANNLGPDAHLRIGQHIVIPDARGISPQAKAAPPAPRAESAPAEPRRATTAAIESPSSARVASPAPAAEPRPIKTAEPAGALPSFRWPVRGRVISSFGPKPNGVQNDGINLAVPQGTPVKAADDGVVAYAGNELKGFGNLVLIRHSNGYVTAYANASAILVKRGDTVRRGQVIAKSGETGNVNAPQLHFEIRKGSTPVDPAKFLNGA
jgi:murein DD-endopeptidase MepM/ murein hydrolase activator NlpD